MSEKKAFDKTRYLAMLSVASVLFGWHAGGGFATGNQANQFFIVSGWWGPLSAVLAILLLTLTVRQAMTMYNLHGLSNYTELFHVLYHPFDKLELVFEVYFFIMTLMATSASIAGAGALFEDVMGVSYGVAILMVGLILLLLTVFGADLVRKVSTVMSLLILICALTIFAVGIISRNVQIGAALLEGPKLSQLPGALLRSLQYAGFQSASIPTMIVCSTVLMSKKECGESMWISFAMNSVALCLAVFMLMGWKDYYSAVDGGSVIPTLTVCLEAFNGCLYLLVGQNIHPPRAQTLPLNSGNVFQSAGEPEGLRQSSSRGHKTMIGKKNSPAPIAGGKSLFRKVGSTKGSILAQRDLMTATGGNGIVDGANRLTHTGQRSGKIGVGVYYGITFYRCVCQVKTKMKFTFAGWFTAPFNHSAI